MPGILIAYWIEKFKEDKKRRKIKFEKTEDETFKFPFNKYL